MVPTNNPRVSIFFVDFWVFFAEADDATKAKTTSPRATCTCTRTVYTCQLVVSFVFILRFFGFFVTLPTQPQPTLARTSRGAVRIRRSESTPLAEDVSVGVCVCFEHIRIVLFSLRVEFY